MPRRAATLALLATIARVGHRIAAEIVECSSRVDRDGDHFEYEHPSDETLLFEAIALLDRAERMTGNTL